MKEEKNFVLKAIVGLIYVVRECRRSSILTRQKREDLFMNMC